MNFHVFFGATSHQLLFECSSSRVCAASQQMVLKQKQLQMGISRLER